MESLLAPYASYSSRSAGRRVDEPAPSDRTDFQRDRDRIIHCNAFRRLEYKTQVFVNHEGDRYRTRLTHTLEVAQIARGICNVLSLNVDLAEAISLAHDLGHTPFGHSGQHALNQMMTPYGGFEHNRQSLRIVDLLEDRYAAFCGLNLTFETREGIAKHRRPGTAPESQDVYDFTVKNGPSLEAQVANLADEIAYNNHDIDDAINAGIITLKEICEVPIFGHQHRQVIDTYPDAPPNKQRYESIRRLINLLITDVVSHTRTSLQQQGIESLAQVRAQDHNLVAFSPAIQQQCKQLKAFLNERVYRYWRVARMGAKAERVINGLFTVFNDRPNLLPPQYQQMIAQATAPRSPALIARVVADYVSGMTDRYAITEYSKLFDPMESV